MTPACEAATSPPWVVSRVRDGRRRRPAGNVDAPASCRLRTPALPSASGSCRTLWGGPLGSDGGGQRPPPRTRDGRGGGSAAGAVGSPLPLCAFGLIACSWGGRWRDGHGPLRHTPRPRSPQSLIHLINVMDLSPHSLLSNQSFPLP